MPHSPELIVFQFICFILPIFLFCMAHVTLNLCAVPFITFTYDKDIPLKWKATIVIHVLSKSLESCCNKINAGIQFSVLTVILCYIKLFVEFFHHFHLKTRYPFCEPDQFSFNFCLFKIQMDIEVPMIW